MVTDFSQTRLQNVWQIVHAEADPSLVCHLTLLLLSLQVPGTPARRVNNLQLDTTLKLLMQLKWKLQHNNTATVSIFKGERSYQSDEAKAFAFVDEDLTGLSIFCKQPPEIILCDVVGQIANKQAAPLCVRFLTRFQEHRQCCSKFLMIDNNITLSSQVFTLKNTLTSIKEKSNWVSSKSLRQKSRIFVYLCLYFTVQSPIPHALYVL